ncbi:MAG: Crp/Fnr family transcriptional regulator [Flammeovirgaceae bacterium]|nr:MAG: Crp/Fnr family transcriptional regulator [Flammeovirgaceae bacterium]
MPVDLWLLKKTLPQLSEALQKQFASEGTATELESGAEILKEGQLVKMIPIVLDGLVKVFTRYEDKELLLYYIRPRESCVMSFLAGIKNQPSRIFALAEERTTLLLLPSQKLERWINEYPQLNNLFYDLYNNRYSELIDTLHQLIFQKLDARLYDYLVEKSRLKDTAFLDIRHREIAQDLGTSREVITRVLKKLEKEGKIRQTHLGIHLL